MLIEQYIMAKFNLRLLNMRFKTWVKVMRQYLDRLGFLHQRISCQLLPIAINASCFHQMLLPGLTLKPYHSSFHVAKVERHERQRGSFLSLYTKSTNEKVYGHPRLLGSYINEWAIYDDFWPVSTAHSLSTLCLLCLSRFTKQVISKHVSVKELKMLLHSKVFYYNNCFMCFGYLLEA